MTATCSKQTIVQVSEDETCSIQIVVVSPVLVDGRVDVIACPEEGEARVNGFEGRLHLHSMGVPSFPDDAIKGLDGADIKTCPNLTTQISHSILLTSILCPPTASSYLSAGPSLSSAPSPRNVTPTPHVWRNGEGKNLW